MRLIGLAALLWLALASPAMAQMPRSDNVIDLLEGYGEETSGLANLSTAHVRVTGTRLETRADGILAAFRQVLVRVTGNVSLPDDPRVAMLDPLVPSLVEDLAYQDMLSNEPKHDEQGTRDRPFDLRVTFSPGRIVFLLGLLGEKPLRFRPPIAIQLTIEDHGITYPLTADGDPDERQREALLAAADRFGLRVRLQPLSGEKFTLGDPRTATLSGKVSWSDTTAGWIGHFQLTLGGKTTEWSITEGVSFDEAYRNAMGTTLAIMAGKYRK